MPVRVKGDPIIYHIQIQTGFDGDWETCSSFTKRKEAIAEAERLCNEGPYKMKRARVIIELVQYETEAK